MVFQPFDSLSRTEPPGESQCTGSFCGKLHFGDGAFRDAPAGTVDRRNRRCHYGGGLRDCLSYSPAEGPLAGHQGLAGARAVTISGYQNPPCAQRSLRWVCAETRTEPAACQYLPANILGTDIGCLRFLKEVVPHHARAKTQPLFSPFPPVLMLLVNRGNREAVYGRLLRPRRREELCQDRFGRWLCRQGDNHQGQRRRDEDRGHGHHVQK